MHSNSKQLWRDVQVFDGQALLDEAMTVRVDDGRVAVPKVLQPYMGGQTVLEPCNWG